MLYGGLTQDRGARGGKDSIIRMLRKLLIGFGSLVTLMAITGIILYNAADIEERSMVEARDEAPGRFLDLADGMTHYEISGPDSGRTVVLVHGFSVPSWIWDPTVGALSRSGFRTIVYDLYGRGYSDRPDGRYDARLFEQQLAGVIDSLGGGAAVDLIGLSMGGAVSVHFAAERPERIRRMVLMAPLNRPVEPALPRPIGGVLLAVRYVPRLPAGRMDRVVDGDRYPDWPRRYVEQTRIEGFRRAIIASMYEFLPADHPEEYRRLGQSDIPVLVIWGEQDTVIPFEEHQGVVEALDARLLRLPGAGHAPHIDRPAMVHRAIIDFLNAPRTHPDTSKRDE